MFCASLHSCCRSGILQPRSDRGCAFLLRRRPRFLRPLTIVARNRAPSNNTLTAVPGITVGHHTLAERSTGCTAMLIEGGAIGGVDVRGAAPATSETDLLTPEKMVQQIHGISLSGGSTFGLDTRGGVVKYLEEKKIGVAYGGMRIPIVPAAAIFDLPVGDARIRPGADCGYRAASGGNRQCRTRRQRWCRRRRDTRQISRHQSRDEERHRQRVDHDCRRHHRRGAGRRQPARRHHRSRKRKDCRRRSQGAGRWLRGRPDADSIGRGATGIGRQHDDRRDRDQRDAYEGAGALARAVGRRWLRACHLADPHDCRRRCVFALATGRKPGEPDMLALGALAADVMATAVIRAATQATGLPNLPAVRDLK